MARVVPIDVKVAPRGGHGSRRSEHRPVPALAERHRREAQIIPSDRDAPRPSLVRTSCQVPQLEWVDRVGPPARAGCAQPLVVLRRRLHPRRAPFQEIGGSTSCRARGPQFGTAVLDRSCRRRRFQRFGVRAAAPPVLRVVVFCAITVSLAPRRRTRIRTESLHSGAPSQGRVA